MGAGRFLLEVRSEKELDFTNNPQINHFKSVYKRYTNFSKEVTKQTLDGTVDFGQTLTCELTKSSDLIDDLFIQFSLSNINANVAGGATPPAVGTNIQYSYVNTIGHAFIKYVQIKIGETIIDRQYGEWMEIWSDLTLTSSKKTGFNNMLGKITAVEFTTPGNTDHLIVGDPDANTRRYFMVPLRFWFCNNIGLALPLVAITDQRVFLTLRIEDLDNLWTSRYQSTLAAEIGTNPTVTSLAVYQTGLYVDSDERRRLALGPLEYIIRQTQRNKYSTVAGVATNNATLNLNFVHPVAELVWFAQRELCLAGDPNTGAPYSTVAQFYPNDWLNFTTTTSSQMFAVSPGTAELPGNTVTAFKFLVNGVLINNIDNMKILSDYIPFRVHSHVPTLFDYVYPFALYPENINQPTGHLNFNRIDSAEVELTLDGDCLDTANNDFFNIKVYATSFNVLRFENGTVDLEFDTENS